MSRILFKSAQLINPEAGNIERGDLLVKDGHICEMGPDISCTDAPSQIIECDGKYLSPGIIDLGVKVCEPGERHKESFRSAGLAAAAGGVSTIITRPDTVPAIDTPETLAFTRRRAQEDCLVNVYHLAALTKGREGREMTEIGFLKDAGALGFTDCDRVVQDTKVLTRALTYARSLDALVIAHPQEPHLSAQAAATSGKFASLRGLPSVPAIAERMGVDRDIALLEMTGAAYHFDQITTARALPALERGKKNGLNITAGTSIHHLCLNELDVANYRTFYKVKPPLRCEDDRLATIEALNSGLIDIISSMHTPQDEESKRLPFQEAASGAVALETLLPAALRLYHEGQIDLVTLIRAMSFNPAKRLGLTSGRLCPGAPADLMLFDAYVPFIMDRFGLYSKSKNTPFDEARMQGRVLKTFVAGREVFTR